MNLDTLSRRLWLAGCCFTLLMACAPEHSQPPAAAQVAIAPAPAAGPETAPAELAGTAWRLLKIMSMDDTTDLPQDPSRYTLVLGEDGIASMVSDCNRGSGSWSSTQPGSISFGPQAATAALCPPPSLSEKYLAQFSWIRSYVLEDGHLFLATMADGAIIEFEPLPPLAATVLRQEVHSSDATEVQQIVLSRLFDDYVAARGLEPTNEQIDSWVKHMQREMAADPNIGTQDEMTPEEAAQAEEIHRDMARSMIQQWNIKRSLYQRFGGRVIFQQLGPEPLDAYRQYLEERSAAGDFNIVDPEAEAQFWRYFRDESMHDFYEPGTEDSAFERAPWEA